MVMTKADLIREFRETGLDRAYWGRFLIQYAMCQWITWDQLADTELLFPYRGVK
jgi:hypothetical protein